MKAISPTHTFDNVWKLKAEVGDHRPTIIKLRHNDKWYIYELKTKDRNCSP